MPGDVSVTLSHSHLFCAQGHKILFCLFTYLRRHHEEQEKSVRRKEQQRGILELTSASPPPPLCHLWRQRNWQRRGKRNWEPQDKFEPGKKGELRQGGFRFGFVSYHHTLFFITSKVNLSYSSFTLPLHHLFLTLPHDFRAEIQLYR